MIAVPVGPIEEICTSLECGAHPALARSEQQRCAAPGSQVADIPCYLQG